MKRSIFLLAAIISSFVMNVQTWNFRIQRLTGSPKVKELRLKPGRQVSIGTLVLDSDSLKESSYFNGYFLGGTRDSIQLRLKEVIANKFYTNGTRQTTIIPAKYYKKTPLQDSSLMHIAVSDIQYLDYRSEKWNIRAEIAEPIILGSLLVMVLSPFIGFKDGSFNGERYKYWALGSTIGLTTGFATVITFGLLSNHKNFQFKTGWPDKKAKVWSFK